MYLSFRKAVESLDSSQSERRNGARSVSDVYGDGDGCGGCDGRMTRDEREIGGSRAIYSVSRAVILQR